MGTSEQSPSANPVLIVAPDPAIPVTPTPSDLTGSATIDDEEHAFLLLINQYRAQNGASDLQISVPLTQAADWLSVDMATQNYFSHSDRLGRSFFTQWKNSSGHNANMLNARYKLIGIGRYSATGSSYGWYWTTDFGS